MTIFLASANNHKKREIAEIIASHHFVLPHERGVTFDFQETGSTFYENAFGKAQHLNGIVGEPVIADDSGLCVPALGGAPGIYSARYGSERSNEKLSDADRNAHLLENMRGIADRRAFFVCCMVLLLSEARFYATQETVHGEITLSSQGDGGFGYDPLFFLPEIGKTAAQLTADEKNSISHRGKAAMALARFIDNID